MDRLQALDLIIRYPALRAMVITLWEACQEEEILDFLFDIELDDSPTSH